MKRVLVAFASLFVLTSASTSFAADLPARVAPAPAFVPAWSWTGWYIGWNVGYSWGRAHNDGTLVNGAGTVLSAASTSFDTNGVIGGGQFGYNWQSGVWLWGFETDFQGSGQKGDGTFTCLAGVCAVAAATSSFEQRLEWFGTVRGRLGYLFTPSWLGYVTGGFAYGDVKTSATILAPTVAGTFSRSTTKTGWTVGAGVEGRITGNWTAKLEYLFMDLGDTDGSFNTTVLAVGGGALAARYRSSLEDHIIRVGVNYKF